MKPENSKKEGKIDKVYTRNGTVTIKLKEEDDKIKIYSTEELMEILNN